MSTKEKDILSLLKILGDIKTTLIMPEERLWWRTDTKYAPITFFLNCNDLFAWACTEDIEITVDNIYLFNESIQDLRYIGEKLCKKKKNKILEGKLLAIEYAEDLYACRVRKERPQKPYWNRDKIPEEVKQLFLACGPEKDY